MHTMTARLAAALCAGLGAAPAQADDAGALAALIRDSELVDLTVTVNENYPAHWPTHNQFQRWTFNWFEPRPGPYSANPVPPEGQGMVGPAVSSVFPYYGQRFVIDEHTGTQTDFPAHFIPPPDSKMPFASKTGWLTGDKYPLRHQMGPAVVVDVRAILDQAKNGFSPAVTVGMLKADEAKHGAIRAGDVVVLYSGYSDKYYRPFPEGNRLAFDPLIAKSAPGWPAPTVEAVEYLASKGVKHMATDGPSMGPVEGGQAVHVAFLKTGGSWTEFTTNLGALPARGAYFISLSAKIVDGSGGLARAIAIKPKGAPGLKDRP